MLVIFYHLGLLQSGFVGVDIFFVLSGYFMAKNFKKIRNGYSKFISGYSCYIIKRARRIMPALLVTILISMVISYFIASPNDIVNYSNEALYTLFGVSNLFYTFNSGYFDGTSDTRLLLHLWSISLEVQFHIIFFQFIGILILIAQLIVHFTIPYQLEDISFLLDLLFFCMRKISNFC